MSRGHDRVRTTIERAAGSARDTTEMFGEVTNALRAAMPLDGWCGHTLDPATAMPTGGDARAGYLPSLVPRLLEIEYLEGDVNAFDTLNTQETPVGVLHTATGGEPGRSARYRDVIAPSGFEHELRAVFRHQGRPWGALVLLRAPDSRPFTGADLSLMASVSGTLATAVRRLLLAGYVETGGLPQSPGLLILGRDRRLETVTPEAQRWVDELTDHDGELPLTVQALVASVTERRGAATRSRVRARSGTWLTLTGWALGDRIAVSLESSAPHDLVALALETYSLSARERQVVELVLIGHSTSEIAQRLHLSPYTVQDHLKAVFDKTGVRSRRELAADLFFKHYLPRIERGAPLGPDGWFAETSPQT
jgi:DNA-binding CsgD family transcriptional regulator